MLVVGSSTIDVSPKGRAMHRRLLPLLAAVLVAPIAVASSPAGAIDQDLVVSAASGAPGDRIEVSSASCTSDLVLDEDDDIISGLLRFLQVRLVVGTAPDQVLAGYAVGSSGLDDSSPAVVVLPDWADADAPAAIEASCIEIDVSAELFEPQFTAFDPAAFDLLPGAGSPTQTAVLSRTELRTGQGFTVEATGCDLPNAVGVETALAVGTDRSGANLDSVAVFGATEVSGADPVTVEVLLNDSGLGFAISLDETGIVDLEVDEFPSTVAAGPHVAYTLCFGETDDGTEALVLEPQAVEVTGTSPTADLDLVVVRGEQDWDHAGAGCDQDLLRYGIEEIEFDPDDFGPIDPEVVPEEASGVQQGWVRALGRPAPTSPFAWAAPTAELVQAAASPAPATAPARAMIDELLTDEVPTAADGTWQVAGATTMVSGLLEATTACGDPFGDGFLYDVQGAAVLVEEAPEPLEPPVAPPADPAPAPATAVPGTPRYTG